MKKLFLLSMFFLLIGGGNLRAADETITWDAAPTGGATSGALLTLVYGNSETTWDYKEGEGICGTKVQDTNLIDGIPSTTDNIAYLKITPKSNGTLVVTFYNSDPNTSRGIKSAYKNDAGTTQNNQSKADPSSSGTLSLEVTKGTDYYIYAGSGALRYTSVDFTVPRPTISVELPETYISGKAFDYTITYDGDGFLTQWNGTEETVNYDQARRRSADGTDNSSTDDGETAFTSPWANSYTYNGNGNLLFYVRAYRKVGEQIFYSDVVTSTLTENTSKTDLTTWRYDNSTNNNLTTLLKGDAGIRVTAEIEPHTEDAKFSADDFEVTLSGEDIFGGVVPTVSLQGGIYQKYVNFLLPSPTATGTATLTFRFKGDKEYNAAEFTRTFTVIDDIVSIQFSASELSIPKGGVTGKLDLTADPEEANELVNKAAVYTWEPIGENVSKSLITIDENGVVTTNMKSSGDAKVTATFTKNSGETVTASYTLHVTVRDPGIQFRFGDNITIDMYEGATYENPLINLHGGSKVTGWSVSDDKIATIENGKLILQKEGTITVTATVNNNGSTEDYTYTLTINPAKETKYVVNPSKTPVPGEEHIVSGMTMTFGGFKNQFGKGTPGEQYLAPSTDASGIDPVNHFFVCLDKNLAKYENNENCDGYDRGYQKKDNKKDYLGTNVPVFGAFYKFEPEVNGQLTVDVLQTGSIQANNSSEKAKAAKKKLENSGVKGIGAISGYNYKALYFLEERGEAVAATAMESHSTYSHPYQYVQDTEDVANEYILTEDEINDYFSLKKYIEEALAIT